MIHISSVYTEYILTTPVYTDRVCILMIESGNAVYQIVLEMSRTHSWRVLSLGPLGRDFHQWPSRVLGEVLPIRTK